MNWWREAAQGFLEKERKTRSLMQPPATGCIVRWHGLVKLGAVQWPIMADPRVSAVVWLSIMSKYHDLDYIRAIRNMDPGRLELQADAVLDLEGNFHVLHRVGSRLTAMTPEETLIMAEYRPTILEITPTDTGIIHVEGIIRPKM